MYAATRPLRIAALLVPCLVLPLAACGKKGPPRPPIKVRPQSVSDLKLRQEGKEVVISFGLPTTMTTGIALSDVMEAQVMRMRSTDPEEPAEPGDTAPRDRFMPAGDFLDDAEVLRKLERADFARALVSGTVEVRDDLVGEPVGGVAPYRYYYGVVVLDGDARASDLSNVESIVPLLPPDAPEDLEAVAQGSTVKLDWKPPSGGKAPAGYLVYRVAGDGPQVRVTAVPTKETDLIDTPPEGSRDVTYLVRSSATKDEPYVQSADAARAQVSLADTQAPGAPEKLRVTSGTGRMEIYWDRSTSSDVKGYHVYRTDKPGGPWQKLTDKPVPETVYLDTTAATGVSWRYAVTAVDGAGNESAKSAEATGRR